MIFLFRLLITIAALIGLATACIPPAFDAVQWDKMPSTPQPGQNDPTEQDAGDSTAFGNNTATGWVHAIDLAANGCTPMYTWTSDRIPSAPGIVLIPYCWARYEKYTNQFEKAWKLWGQRLGYPNQHTNHRLGGFHEVTDGPAAVPCYDEQGGWSSAMNADVLAIKPFNDLAVGNGWATTGYRYSTFDDAPGRHAISIGVANIDNLDTDDYEELLIHTLAHEMGHVFGLLHEHQRPDRDRYIHFQCENLRGYAATKVLVETRNQHTMEQVCKSVTLSKSYNNFGAHAFSTEQRICRSTSQNLQGPEVRTMSRTYDWQSIMHYDSWSGSDHRVEDGTRPGVDKMPLVLWKRDYGENEQVPDRVTAENAEYIETKKVPSPLDISALRELYPW